MISFTVEISAVIEFELSVVLLPIVVIVSFCVPRSIVCKFIRFVLSSVLVLISVTLLLVEFKVVPKFIISCFTVDTCDCKVFIPGPCDVILPMISVSKLLTLIFSSVRMFLVDIESPNLVFYISHEKKRFLI